MTDVISVPEAPDRALHVASGASDFRSILLPPGQAPLPERWNLAQPDWFRDLNLDQVVSAICGRQDNEELRAFFYTPASDPGVVLYRQAVFRDLVCPSIDEVVTDLVEDIRRVIRLNGYSRKLEFRCHRLVAVRDAIELYCQILRRAKKALASSNLHAEGLRAFLQLLDEQTSDEAFLWLEAESSAVAAELNSLRFSMLVTSRGVIVRQYAGEPDYSAKILSLFERFRHEEEISASEPPKGISSLNHVEAGVLDRVGLLFPEPFARLERFVAAAGDFIHPLIARFEREMRFYMSYIHFVAPLVESGLPFCYPEVSATKKDFLVEDGFDLALAIKLSKNLTLPVLNSARLDHGERIFVVSGPNQGGKTTFARMFGQLHHLAALGCPIPGRSARIFICNQIFTHFEREEHPADLKSKLENDLLRIRAIYAAATSQSVIVLNEIFASTTLADQILLSRHVMEATVRLAALAVCVTFIDELSQLAPSVVSMVAAIDPREPGRRTFRIERRPADGLAYALSLAQRHRVTREQIAQRLAR